MDSPPRSLTRVAVYRRSVRASLERVWENVLDWEHLPWLHGSSFAAIEAEDAGSWGWRARVALPPVSSGREFLLELRIDRDARRYVARTLEGIGAGTEIWTQLDVVGPQRTAVEVEFHVPGVEPGSADALGRVYSALYRRLWDEDEAMMMRRAELLDAGPRAAPGAAPALALGALETLRARLPLRVDFDARAFWVVEVDGELHAYSPVCPHRLGPLEAAELLEGCITCPWHGYRFDVRTGRSADGRGLRLANAPRIRVDPRSSEVWLSWGMPARERA
jgi:nitrite reductase/ring-hydroxylating ferredoxin subunit